MVIIRDVGIRLRDLTPSARVLDFVRARPRILTRHLLDHQFIAAWTTSTIVRADTDIGAAATQVFSETTACAGRRVRLGYVVTTDAFGWRFSPEMPSQSAQERGSAGNAARFLVSRCRRPGLQRDIRRGAWPDAARPTPGGPPGSIPVGVTMEQVSRSGASMPPWRRGWDSNPRCACTHNGFRDRPDRPLWHLSTGGAEPYRGIHRRPQLRSAR